ncbi:MAG: choice-of-anchor B family protein [Saprospiraceae bacterium]|nr:choice-of-anchor B family protein [Saprospiraceae bacterium]
MKKMLFPVLALALLAFAHPAIAQNFNMVSRATMDFPGQTLANICGYTQNGREYALLGGSLGMIVVDITDPDNPVNLVQIPGPNNLWKEIKVYQHYAYVTSEGGQGLQIIDLSPLPATILPYHFYTGDGPIAGQLNTIHALHIDVEKGFVYLYGSNLFSGGPVVLDINADPYNPTYAGNFDQLGYVHDGYAENDILYGSHIYAGILSIVDMSDKQDPVVLGTIETPGQFTHNSWLLDNNQVILTTDEATPSYVTSYDISDPTDIKELDRVSTNDGNGSIGHNTHVLNDWAITSWYTDGVVIIDAHKPDNLVITGWYDTWAPPLTGDFFQGAWGAFPFFPSGTIVASNIEDQARLTVLTPTYVRAAYLEGTVTNGCNGQPVSGATITVNSNDPFINTLTDNNGVFKTGQAAAGNFTVTISKPGFDSQTIPVTLVNGEVTNLNVVFEVEAYNIQGTVLEEGTNLPLANAPVELSGPANYTLQTNPNGAFNLDCVPAGNYEATVGYWGYLPGNMVVNANGNATIYLEKGYYDGFALNLGWTSVDGSNSGHWERGVPVGTTYQGESSNPGIDSDGDINTECYVTGNGGGDAGNDDVDNGTNTLTTPPMNLAGYDDAILNFDYWFLDDGGSGNPNDNFTVTVSNGTQTATLLTETESESAWRNSGDIHLADFITLTNNVKVSFSATDQQPGHLVEAAVDVFQVTPVAASAAVDIDPKALVSVTPNPSSTDFHLKYQWSHSGTSTLQVRNMLGQLILNQTLVANSGTLRFGAELPRGAYQVVLLSEGRQSEPVLVVKQ